MKTLSIQQPWAWLIVHGHKSIENRTWKTHFRGRFLVHAGKGVDRESCRSLHYLFPEIKLPLIDELERGGIVGQAELVDCLPPGSELMLTAEDRRWYNGAHAFMLKNAKPLPFLPTKGMLGFFATDYPLLDAA